MTKKIRPHFKPGTSQECVYLATEICEKCGWWANTSLATVDETKGIMYICVFEDESKHVLSREYSLAAAVQTANRFAQHHDRGVLVLRSLFEIPKPTTTLPHPIGTPPEED